jgi:WhiB family redox-sensing transcriptional regulator
MSSNGGYPAPYRAPRAVVQAEARPARRMAPLAEDVAWQTDAACRGLKGAAVFYPSGSPSQVAAAEAAAKRVCGRCPVLQSCLQWSLDTREPWGVWGGLTQEERRAVLGLPPRNKSARVIPVQAGAVDAQAGVAA